MTKHYDALVFGAGSNSLTTAAYLAKSGLSVCVFEKNAIVGGGAVSQEVTAPGFKHDTHAASIFFVLANPMIKDDELELRSKHGLDFIYPDLLYASVFEDDTWLGCFRSLDETCQSLAQYSEKDAETYRAFAQRAGTIAPMLFPSFFVPPAPPEQGAEFLAQSAEGREILELFPRSALEYILETYEHPKVQMHFLRWVAEGANSPSMPGTTPWLYLFAAMAHTIGGAVTVGGTQGISDALARCIQHHGGEIKTETWVKRVIVEGGEAKGVELSTGEVIMANKCVVGTIHPHALNDYVEGLDPDMVQEAANMPLSTFGVIHSHFALHETPKYKASIPPSLIVLTAPSSIADLTSICDDSASGMLPRLFSALVNNHSVFDPTRTPEGKHALALLCHAPLELRDAGPLGHGAIDGWNDEIRDEYKEWLLAEYSKYCTNMTADNVIASAIHSPHDMSQWSPSFKLGDTNGISAITPMGRPTPRLSQYAVPGANGLYLTGPFCHPGGSVSGGGRATAVKILSDLGSDLAAVFSV